MFRGTQIKEKIALRAAVIEQGPYSHKSHLDTIQCISSIKSLSFREILFLASVLKATRGRINTTVGPRV